MSELWTAYTNLWYTTLVFQSIFIQRRFVISWASYSSYFMPIFPQKNGNPERIPHFILFSGENDSLPFPKCKCMFFPLHLSFSLYLFLYGSNQLNIVLQSINYLLLEIGKIHYLREIDNTFIPILLFLSEAICIFSLFKYP